MLARIEPEYRLALSEVHSLIYTDVMQVAIHGIHSLLTLSINYSLEWGSLRLAPITNILRVQITRLSNVKHQAVLVVLVVDIIFTNLLFFTKAQLQVRISTAFFLTGLRKASTRMGVGRREITDSV